MPGMYKDGLYQGAPSLCFHLLLILIPR
jgi:hypothetical protein